MEEKDAIIKRLRRVEGQIKGIQKMVDEEKFCGDILTQISAARAALNSVGGLILERHMKQCLTSYLEGVSKEEDLDQLVKTMLNYTKSN